MLKGGQIKVITVLFGFMMLQSFVDFGVFVSVLDFFHASEIWVPIPIPVIFWH